MIITVTVKIHWYQPQMNDIDYSVLNFNSTQFITKISFGLLNPFMHNVAKWPHIL